MCIILVVEDNAILRKMFRDTLETTFPNSSIAEAGNGKEALGWFDDLSPEIIILDIKLPDTNGLLLAKRMRANGSTADIIMLTAYDLPEYRIAAMENGADYFIVKGNATSAEIMEIVGSIMVKRQCDLSA